MDNLDFQKELLSLAEQGYTVIVESRKLANQLQWRYRMRLPETGRVGWEQPTIVTLNAWAERFWENLWPETWPASTFSRWRLLLQTIEDLPPPQPLRPDIPLVLQLDETVEHCLRYGVDPGRGEAANELVAWRRSLWEPYGSLMSHSGLFHPASLPQKLFDLFKCSPDLIPQKLVFVGFEFTSHWEKELLRLVCGQPMVQYLSLPEGTKALEAITCANPEQELYALLEDLAASAGRLPLHELAVVILAPDVYAPALTKYLYDLFGLPLVGHDAAYNLIPNRSLVQQPLFQAAFLPVDFAMKEQSRTLLLSLLRSPYYGYLGRVSRSLMQWDWSWRNKNLESGLEVLIDSLGDSEKEMLPQKGQELVDGLNPLLVQHNQTGHQWLEKLQEFWRKMEFPVLANEGDQVGWQRLQEILSEFATAFGRIQMNLKDLMGWLRMAAEKTYVQEKGFEDAGVQIIGGLDSRGLAFERVYIPGLIMGALPQPARPFPFLSREERKVVQGGTPEGQHAFAQVLFKQFQMMAPDLVLSRPLSDAKGEHCLPSPFWPAEYERIEAPTVPWKHHLPALQRAGWISEGITGICLGADRERKKLPSTEIGFFVNLMEPPDEISVNRLEVLLTCPMRFFIQELLGIEPLPEVRRGLDPRKRGQLIHQLLKSFGETLVGKKPSPDWERRDLLEALNHTVASYLEPLCGDPCWAVERRRLVSTVEGQKGLLDSWLDSEWGRLLEGWQWFVLEAAFRGLKFSGSSIRVNGRLDRVDVHSQEGLFCWDYKTGAIPRVSDIWEKFTAPQLPVYLIALGKNLIPGIPEDAAGMGAGYIDLRSTAQLKHGPGFQLSDRIVTSLKAWEERIAGVLIQLQQGDLSPCWLRGSCDVECRYECFCEILFPEDL
jgi:RecB family exonuclease